MLDYVPALVAGFICLGVTSIYYCEIKKMRLWQSAVQQNINDYFQGVVAQRVVLLKVLRDIIIDLEACEVGEALSKTETLYTACRVASGLKKEDSHEENQ